MTKADLQEEALQLEVSIYYPDGHEKEGKEMTVEDLKAVVAERKAALEAEHQQRQADAAAARDGADEEADEEDGTDEEEEDEEEDEPAPAPKAARKSRKKAAPVVDPPAERLKLMGCRKPGDKDRALAAKHGYPVAVPGGKAYRTSVSFNCSLGGGLRPAGSVVILTDEQAQHKKDFLTPVR